MAGHAVPLRVRRPASLTLGAAVALGLVVIFASVFTAELRRQRERDACAGGDSNACGRACLDGDDRACRVVADRCEASDDHACAVATAVAEERARGHGR